MTPAPWQTGFPASASRTAATPIDTGDDEDEWSAKLVAAVIACPDTLLYDPEMMNIYIINNTFGANSFTPFTSITAPDCYAMNMIEAGRFPSNPTEPLEWVSDAGEHEMGHTFDLSHTCESDPPNSVLDDSNIMQSTAGDCCQEAQAIDNDTGDTATPDTGTWWAQNVAADCSGDTADLGINMPAGCDGSPGDWFEPQCITSDFTTGSREHGFTNDVNGTRDAATPGQITRILDAADRYCECVCDERRAAAPVATAISGELPCHAGSGRVAFFPFRAHDRDDDGTAMVELVPIVISGDHLGRLSWITSVNVADWGDATNLVAATDGNGWAFLPGEPDSLDTTSLELFDSGRTSGTLASGVVRSGYLWATDGIDLPASDWAWPEAVMVWGCYSDYQADDVQWVSRPANAYVLKIKDVVGDWGQEILVRPDYNSMSVWMELRGNPRVADRIALGSGQNGTYTWSYTQAGMEATGWLKPAGNPTGSKLEVHLDEVTYDAWSISNVTLPILSKLP